MTLPEALRGFSISPLFTKTYPQPNFVARNTVKTQINAPERQVCIMNLIIVLLSPVIIANDVLRFLMAKPARLGSIFKSTVTAAALTFAAFGSASAEGSNTSEATATSSTSPQAEFVVEKGRKYTEGEAYRISGAPRSITDPEERKRLAKMVLHYGDDIKNADLAARGFNERGYNTVALPGGKPGTISLIINRSHPIEYTQRELYDGTLVSDARIFYKERVGEPNPPVRTIASLQADMN